MDSFPFHLLLLFTFLFANPIPVVSSRSLSSTKHESSRITVVGAVYCDTCITNAFSRHSYFLPGVDVQIRCKFKAKSEKTTEQVNYSVNRTTDKFGVYKLEIPSVDGMNCINGLSMVSMCQATLLGTSSSSSYCSVPSLKATSDEISIKSEQDNLCIYSLNALSYKPHKKNTILCANKKQESANSLESSKCFFPFPWPSIPSFRLPPFPWPNGLPPFPPANALISPPPSAPLVPSAPPFNLWDPRTWIPSNPPSPPDQNP